VARSADSTADRELTARLAARGLIGSGARYERWRRAGLLPRHERHGAGRGRGSVSALDPATVEIAAALARHAVQGRDLRAVVVAWFFEAGRPTLPGQSAVPEPPDAAVIESLAWAVRTDPLYRMVERARSASTEAQKDDFYAAATEHARRAAGMATGFDPSVVREALVAGRDPDLASSGVPGDLVHLVAVVGLGVDEVGPEAFAEAITATGYFPQMSAQEWRDVMIKAFVSGDYAEEFAALARLDLAAAIENAGIERLREAREVALGLAGFGAMLLMHGLLMPDTPGLAALRARVGELGVGPALINLARQVMRPPAVAAAVAGCLDPAYVRLYQSLMESVAAGPPLLHLAGDDRHDSEGFMETWLSSIQALGSRSGPTAAPAASVDKSP
jgi:hypothetical protein